MPHAMKLTTFLIVLPLVVFYIAVNTHPPYAALFAVWSLLALVCLIRGIYVFRLHRWQAFCCFAFTLIQTLLVLLPVLMIRRHSV